MKREIYQHIEIIEGVEAELDGATLKIKGKEGEQTKNFRMKDIEFKKEGNKIVIGSKKATKKEKKVINAVSSHIRNMMKGALKKFEYDLKICSSHFPMSVEVKEGGVTVKNFLGEKTPRHVKMPLGVEIKVDKDLIKVLSVDKELAGQVAAKLETLTKIRNRDRRVFQDGIFITSKSGREI